MNDIPRYMYRVNAALALREIDRGDALKQLEKASKLAPEDPYVELLMGLIRQDDGLDYKNVEDLEDAEDHFRKALNIDPNYKKAKEALGLVLYIMGRFYESIELLKPLAISDPANKEVCITLGKALNRIEKPEEAIEFLYPCYQIHPDDVNLTTQLADTLDDADQTQKAIDLLLQAIEKKPSAELYNSLGEIYLDDEKYDDAIQVLNKSTKIDPKLVVAWVNLTHCYIETGQLDEALITSELGEGHNRKNPHLLQIKAEVLWLFNKKNESIELYTQITDYLRERNEISDDRMIVFIRLMRYEMVHGVENKILEIDRELQRYSGIKQIVAPLLGSKIKSYIQLEKYGEAKLTIEENPDTFPIEEVFAIEYYQSLIGLGDTIEAEKYLNEKINNFDNEEDRNSIIEDLKNLGNSYYQEGKIASVRATLLKILEFDPNNAPVMHILASILIFDHKWENALDLLNQAEKNEFESIDILYAKRGYIYLQLGELDQAIKAFNEALDIFTDERVTIIQVAYPLKDKLYSTEYPIRSVPLAPAIFGNLACAYYLKGKFEKAYEASLNAIEADPDEFIGYCIKGCLNFNEGKVEEACAAWNNALECEKSEEEEKIVKNWMEYCPSEA